MKRSSTDNSSERIGRRLGRTWRRLMRAQNVFRGALLRAGLPRIAVNLAIAFVWILVVAALLRFGLGVAIVAVALVVLTFLDPIDIPNSVEQEPQWRDGLLGFGLYNAEGLRIDPHDPDRRQ